MRAREGEEFILRLRRRHKRCSAKAIVGVPAGCNVGLRKAGNRRTPGSTGPARHARQACGHLAHGQRIFFCQLRRRRRLDHLPAKMLPQCGQRPPRSRSLVAAEVRIAKRAVEHGHLCRKSQFHMTLAASDRVASPFATIASRECGVVWPIAAAHSRLPQSARTRDRGRRSPLPSPQSRHATCGRALGGCECKIGFTILAGHRARWMQELASTASRQRSIGRSRGRQAGIR